MSDYHDTSFELFGEQHLMVLLVILFFTVALPYVVKRTRSERVIKIVAVSIAIALLLTRIMEPAYRLITDRPWRTLLPLHLCDVGSFLTCIMLINRNYFLYELNYFWALGGTIQAVLTPDLIDNYTTIDFLIYFSMHGLIILGAIYATVLFNFRPTVKSIWRTYAVTLLYALFIIPVNLILNTNFLYIFQKPDSPSLLDYLGPWPWYVIILVFLCPLIFFFYYSPFFVMDQWKKIRKK